MKSCKEIVKLISSSEEKTFFQRIELKAHLMMCHHCSRYSQQLRMLTDGFRKLFQNDTQVDHEKIRELEKTVVDEIEKRKSGT